MRLLLMALFFLLPSFNHIELNSIYFFPDNSEKKLINPKEYFSKGNLYGYSELENSTITR